MTGTAVATFRDANALVLMLNDDTARATITPMLPEGVTYERVIREVYMVASDNPSILKCSGPSIIRAICKVESWGLVIGETAHLVPYKGICKAIQDYKGKIELMVRHRAARLIEAHCVYEKEHFVYKAGTSPVIEHWPIMDPQSRGELVGAYAYARITSYDFKAVVISKQEIDEIRRQYSHQWSGGTLDEIPWYAIKTAIHRLSKQIPKSEALAKALADDDDDDEPLQPAVARAEVVEPRRPVPLVTNDADYAPEPQLPQPKEVAARSASVSAPNSAVEHWAQQPNPYDETPNTIRDERTGATAAPKCPKCNGGMWDNRSENAERRRSGQKQRPDFACKDKKKCGHVIWPDDDRTASVSSRNDDEFPSALVDENDDLPF